MWVTKISKTGKKETRLVAATRSVVGVLGISATGFDGHEYRVQLSDEEILRMCRMLGVTRANFEWLNLD